MKWFKRLKCLLTHHDLSEEAIVDFYYIKWNCKKCGKEFRWIK